MPLPISGCASPAWPSSASKILGVVWSLPLLWERGELWALAAEESPGLGPCGNALAAFPALPSGTRGSRGGLFSFFKAPVLAAAAGNQSHPISPAPTRLSLPAPLQSSRGGSGDATPKPPALGASVSQLSGWAVFVTLRPDGPGDLTPLARTVSPVACNPRPRPGTVSESPTSLGCQPRYPAGGPSGRRGTCWLDIRSPKESPGSLRSQAWT